MCTVDVEIEKDIKRTHAVLDNILIGKNNVKYNNLVPYTHYLILFTSILYNKTSEQNISTKAVGE